MVRPCLCKEASKADVDAILKRATFLVNTKNFVYYRKAGINEEHVPRKSMVNADYLTDEGKKWYGQFKDDKKGMPADFEIEVEKEQTWLRLMYKNIAQSRQSDWAHRQNVRSLFESERQSSSCLSQATTAHAQRIAIKREKVEEEQSRVFKKEKVWSCKLRATNTVIDLEDDSAHDAASDASVSLEQALEEIMDNENEDDEEDVFQHGNLT